MKLCKIYIIYIEIFFNVFELKFWRFVNENGFMEILFGDLLFLLINIVKEIKKFNFK